MMEPIPSVSVVMAVKDAANRLHTAVNSICSQSVDDFELVVVDHGSSDTTPLILGEMAETDSRIKVHHRPDLGVATALNFAVSQARSELVAQVEPNSVSRPERLELQASFMHAHPEVGLVGSGALIRDASGNDSAWAPFTAHGDIRDALIRDNQFAGATVMFRRSSFEFLGGYRPIEHAHDYDLWLRFAQADRVANMDQQLVTQFRDRATAAASASRTRLEWRVRMDAIERGDYPRSALLRLVKPALSARVAAPFRLATRRILRPQAAA